LQQDQNRRRTIVDFRAVTKKTKRKFVAAKKVTIAKPKQN
jgi:hypothetical protein